MSRFGEIFAKTATSQMFNGVPKTPVIKNIYKKTYINTATVEATPKI